jgi:class 3 adenylate cyclase
MGRQPVESTLALLSSTNRTGRWQAKGVTQATALLGTCTIDLREAEIDGDRLLVRASAVLGSIHIIVAERTDVDLTGTALLGSIKDRRKSTEATVAGGPDVRVEAFALCGSVIVANEPIQRDEEQSSIDEVAESVAEERPLLHQGTAPDGTTTVLFSDIEGFTAMNDRLGDHQAFEVLKTHNQIVRDEVEAYGGFEVKSQGDGFMVAFSSARQALLCAIAIQKALAARSGGEPVRVRMGLHTGEAIKDADDFFGRNVIFAARIADQAEGGEILVSSLVKELTESGGEFRFENGREVALKGLSGTGKVYSLEWGEAP